MSPESFPAVPTYCQFYAAACLAVVFIAVGTLSQASMATGQDANPNTSAVSDVLATVNGIAISADQVERDIARTLPDLHLGPAQKKQAQAATLEKLINQRVAFEFLKKHDVAASDDEVGLQIEDLKAELATIEKTIDDYLDETKQTLDEFQFQTAWQLSWKRYLARKLTDEFLESHFNSNKRSMDGTELKVAHLLLKTDKNKTAERLSSQIEKAKSIVDQIKSRSTTWDEAVAKHSEAPTRNSGGDIGWIEIDKPMPHSFSTEAFKLSAGEISQPVTTRFGVHIIKCLEVKERKLGWRDVIDEVKKSAARAYFDAIVVKHRPEVSIKK